MQEPNSREAFSFTGSIPESGNRPPDQRTWTDNALFHSLSTADSCARLDSPDDGLTEAQVTIRRQQSGPNRLVAAPAPARWQAFARQFTSGVVVLLIAAAIISGLLAEWIDTVAILTIVLLNGILGFLQEDRSRRALESLRKLSAPMARVIRAGQLQNIAAGQIVPGDRIQLESGDLVPADCRLLESARLVVQESTLTGESEPAAKEAAIVLDAVTDLGDRRNMVYASTTVAAGTAAAVVVATRHANTTRPNCRPAGKTGARANAAGTSTP
jgi:P-type Ca2+ transporter type 2C